MQGKKSTPLWLVVKRLAYWSLVLAVWGSLMLAGVVAYYAYDLPDPAALDTEYRTPGITLLAADGAVLGTAGPVHAEPVALAELPATLPRAVLAIEDRRFYLHSGVDWFGVARAAIRNLLAGRVVQGGSTITQQLAKNLFLTSERSFRRKIRELLLALWLEHRFTKDQLLTIYLNRVYLGGGTYGVEAAAWRYFGKTVRNLSLPEAAMIAGLLKAPSRYAPTRNLMLAQSRAGQVLDRMVASGWLDQVEAAAAKRSPARPTGAYIGSGGARYFVDWVLERVPSYVGPPRHDLIIETSLKPAF
ncbi:MAG: transglycosylase domain-containing protein, partial [Alphaproteobacteria bacterium]